MPLLAWGSLFLRQSVRYMLDKLLNLLSGAHFNWQRKEGALVFIAVALNPARDDIDLIDLFLAHPLWWRGQRLGALHQRA